MKPSPRRRSRDGTWPKGSRFCGTTWQLSTHGPFVQPGDVKHLTAVPDKIIRFSLISFFFPSFTFFIYGCSPLFMSLIAQQRQAWETWYIQWPPVTWSALVCVMFCSLVVAGSSQLGPEPGAPWELYLLGSLMMVILKVHHRAARKE